jgi:hypothetical protein
MPVNHLEFIRNCRDYFETVRHIFVHLPDRGLASSLRPLAQRVPAAD